LRLFSFGGYGLALAALALVVFGAFDCYPVPRSISTLSWWKKGGKRAFLKVSRARLCRHEHTVRRQDIFYGKSFASE